jgi:hypothetical protein
VQRNASRMTNASTRSARLPRVTPGAQYCTGIGQRKVHHLPGR